MKAPVLHIESWFDYVFLAGWLCAIMLVWAGIGYRMGFMTGNRIALQEMASKTNKPPESLGWITNVEIRTNNVEYWATNTIPGFTGKTWKAEEPTPRQRMERDMERVARIHAEVNESIKR